MQPVVVSNVFLIYIKSEDILDYFYPELVNSKHEYILRAHIASSTLHFKNVNNQ